MMTRDSGLLFWATCTFFVIATTVISEYA